MAFAPAAADASSALPSGQPLQVQELSSLLASYHRHFLLMGQYYCAHFMLLFGGT
jgi:hypothetical protein